MRRHGEPRIPGMKYTRRPGVYVILPREDKLLMTYQAAPHWEVQLPGGGIDPNEAPITALHRECMEETGWVIAQPRKLTVYKRFVEMPEYGIWAEKVCHIYVAHPVRRKCAPLEPGHTALWATPDEALSLVASDGDRAALKYFLSLNLR